ncbi:MAG: sporulation protein YabP [Bacilli bacterium]
MDKFAENISYNHGISINERKMIYITGVNKIESFDEEEFLLDTNMGFLAIKGNCLEIVRLDTKDGVVSIKGNVDSFAYFENIKKGSKSSLFEKLFK